jgi:hypothetical protein
MSLTIKSLMRLKRVKMNGLVHETANNKIQKPGG